MAAFIIIGLVLIAVVVGLIFLFYWIPKKIGYPRVGKYLSITAGLFFVSLTFWMIFEDQLFSKNDVKNY